jgi:hypothetical protein
VIPAAGVGSGVGAFALAVPVEVAVASGLAGAAFAAAVRALAGDSPASICATLVAPLLALALLADAGALDLRACFAVAAAGWTIAELARTTSHPLVAMLPATVGAVLAPALVPALVLAAARLVTAPWQRPGWIVVAPTLGVLGIVLAVLAGLAESGALATLGTPWFGAAPDAIAPTALAARAGAALGPLVAVAAVVGATLAFRFRLAELAIASWIAGAILVDLRAGTIGPSTLAVAALCTGLAVGRFAGSIRIASGQAFAGATAALLLLLPPAWSTIEHGPHVAHVTASR